MSNNLKSLLPKEYELLDSGGFQKLERFGHRIIVRPCSIACWKQNKGISDWNMRDVQYIPDRENGWQFTKGDFDNWFLNLPRDIKIKLRLQKNGQIGFFPEHFIYLPKIAEEIERLKTLGLKSIEVLNLFAYTGMASVFCAKVGANVTHVEIAKVCLDWANENVEANKLNNIRFIKDDAIGFINRQSRGAGKYNIVIADPPNFSRISRNREWQLERNLPKLIESIAQLVTPEHFSIIFTAHLHQFAPEVVGNLFNDAFQGKVKIHCQPLVLPETSGQRVIPFGNLTWVSR